MDLYLSRINLLKVLGHIHHTLGDLVFLQETTSKATGNDVGQSGQGSLLNERGHRNPEVTQDS